jgi:hypothetical protein
VGPDTAGCYGGGVLRHACAPFDGWGGVIGPVDVVVL